VKRFSALILAIILVVAAFAGCATQNEERSNEYGGTFHDYVTVSPPILNTHINTDATTINRALSTVLYKEYLNEEGTGYNFECMLAADLPQQMDEEGKVWQIKIRDDYYWADYGPTKGKKAKMNADTVIYSFKMCLDPDLLNPKASLLTNNSYMQILNSYEYQQQYTTGNMVEWDEVGLKKVDEYTIELTTVKKTSQQSVMATMGSYVWGYMIYEPLFEECLSEDRSYTTYGTDFDTWASSGEYMLKEWLPDSKITIIRNPDYVRADEIFLDAIEFHVVPDASTALELFEAGQLDRVELLYQQWEQYEEDPRTYEYYSASCNYLFINNGNRNNNGLLGNLNFRKAIYYGVDRMEFASAMDANPNTRIYKRAVICDRATGKSILDVPVDWADDPTTVMDRAKSAEYLSKAYEECGISGANLETIYIETATHTRASIEIFQKQMNENFKGITVKNRSVPTSLTYKLRRWDPENPDAYEFNIGALAPSNETPLDTMKFFSPTYSQPVFYWDNMPDARDRFGKLYEDAEQALRDDDWVKLTDLCLEMEELLVKEIYIRVPLYEIATKRLYSERVQLPVKEYVNGYGFGELYAKIVE